MYKVNELLERTQIHEVRIRPMHVACNELTGDVQILKQHILNPRQHTSRLIRPRLAVLLS